ncbi:dihydroxy-acid dehydratase [Steroidobacter agaridevorans]|uniref:Dihydroxy-acid dehydratase n=1 Tax=Steroidobacter agaridevorans TaxID=2695856 RepID=A0A829YEV8_9GAMM|nr:IlvD/Edd family dehydratase [Steroidobacter agaridevorans]GFE81146.1 dihydroxy-acid dehydratase [Steroidobacter agaridevorans]GFE88969.1 dihydroxy-acid dehydratase [Steroidobacter agaridevorans]
MSPSNSNPSATRRLRSRAWFDDPANADMTALYLERYMNFGLSLQELQSGKPIIGIAQTGSDLSPCNRHHMVLAERVREGIREAGGVVLEFPVHPIQETGKRPTAGLDRNLAYLGLVEVLFGYPLDGVVLTVGCDKTTPACLMAAATVNMPAIALSVGPMLNGWYKGVRTGSGTIVWRARELLAAGEIDYQGFIKLVASSAPSTGYCNTMGTATTMNSLTEALGMSLPGSAAIPAPLRDRQECAYLTGKQIVEMVWADRKPSDILTREAFINAIRVNSAIGGSTNAPIHLNALARHIGVELTIDDWQKYGLDIPLLVNLQPAGEYLGEDYYRAGGVPAVVAELMRQGLINEKALTVNGSSLGDNCRGASIIDTKVIKPFEEPMKKRAGFTVLRGNLFDSAIMKTSVISDEFRARYLSNPKDPEAFEGRAIVFDGPEDYHARIDDPSLGIDESTLMFMRGAGPVGYPGAAEVVNMRPPVNLIKAGIHNLPCIGDGRQSGTSGSPSILNASPEAAVGGGLALLKTGDRVRIDLRKGEANILISEEELNQRRQALKDAGGFPYPPSQTPWQEMQRADIGQAETGAVLESAVKYQRLAQTKGVPRHNH